MAQTKPKQQRVQVARPRPFVILWTALWVIVAGLVVRRVLEVQNAPPKPNFWKTTAADTRRGQTIDPIKGFRPGVAECNYTPAERVALDAWIRKIKEERRIAWREREEREARERWNGPSREARLKALYDSVDPDSPNALWNLPGTEWVKEWIEGPKSEESDLPIIGVAPVGSPPGAARGLPAGSGRAASGRAASGRAASGRAASGRAASGAPRLHLPNHATPPRGLPNHATPPRGLPNRAR